MNRIGEYICTAISFIVEAVDIIAGFFIAAVISFAFFILPIVLVMNFLAEALYFIMSHIGIIP